jgi:two-component system, NarL family, response regulator DegU
MLKIGIVDDHQLFRKSLRILINTFKDTEVLFEAENGMQLLECPELSKIDILLLDIQMPEMDGYETCTIIRREYPDIKILILSQLATKQAIRKVMDLGAHGFFSKNSNPEQLREAIKNIQAKDFYFGQDLGIVIKEALLWEKEKEQKLPKVMVSKREMDVIKLVCKEFSSIEIADRLCITVRTVDTHRKRMMERTNSKNFIGVVLFALKQGILHIEDI